MTDTQKKVGAITLAVATVALLGAMLWRTFGGQSSAPSLRTLMDAETGQLVTIKATEVGPLPMTNPKTGKRTLYLTERCFWGEKCNKDGGTHVIMNELMGKAGPTKCPVCGHVVYFHNPRPSQGEPE